MSLLFPDPNGFWNRDSNKHAAWTAMIASIGLSGHDQDIISLVIRYVVVFDISVAFLYFGKTSYFHSLPVTFF